VGKSTRIYNIAQLLSVRLRCLPAAGSYELLEAILKGCTRTKVWLLLPHIVRQSQQNQLLIYHHLTSTKMDSKQAKGFEYFLTFTEEEVVEAR